jgi:hypothetical protein
MRVVQRQYAVVEAPSVLGLKSTGVDRLAQCVLENGLAARVNARYAGRVDPPQSISKRDPAVGLEVTIYNPALDEHGSAGRGLTGALAAALGTSAPWRDSGPSTRSAL